MIFKPNSTIVCVGDSITDCGRVRPLGEGRDAKMGTSYVAHVNALLRVNYPDLRLRMINMGVSGNTSTQLLERWDSDVLALKPDWVTVLIGINDVWRQFEIPQIKHIHVYIDEYKENLQEMVRRTLPQTKNIILMSPFFMELNKDDPMRVMMDAYSAAMREVAEEFGIMFVDIQKGFDEYMSHGHHAMSIAWDRVHPDMTGHTIILRELLNAVGFEWKR